MRLQLKELSSWQRHLDAFGRQFEPYLTARCVCRLVAPLWSDLGNCFRTVAVIKAAVNPNLSQICMVNQC